MNTRIKKQLQEINRLQQYKIWLERIADRTTPFLWWSASILFIGGVSYQFILPVDTALVILLALLPTLLNLIWITVSVKPSVNEGAIAADKLLGVNSLFISAWELTRSPSEDDVRNLLLQRTEIALPEWHQRLSEQPKKYSNPSTLAAITVGLSGLFLMLLPASSQPRTFSFSAPPATNFNLQQGSESYPQRHESAKKLGEVFNTTQQTTSSQSGLPPNQDIPMNSSMDQQSQDLLNSSQPMHGEDHNDTAPSNPRASSSRLEELPAMDQAPLKLSPLEGKKIAGHTAGNDTGQASNSAAAKAAEFDQIQLIDISTMTDSDGSAFDHTKQGNTLVLSIPEQNLPRLLSNRQTRNGLTVDSNTLLSAEQRILVKRYFKQLDKNDESNK